MYLHIQITINREILFAIFLAFVIQQTLKLLQSFKSSQLRYLSFGIPAITFHQLFARGGGGTPEAVKTALLQLAEKRCDGKLFVIHLTDAPPHEVARLDTEGKKEFEALGAEKFDWIHVTEEFMKAFPSLRYTCLTSHPHPFFSYLSQTTLGSVYPLEGSVNVTNIRKQLGRVLNGLFGLGDAPDSQSAISTSEFSNEKELSATKCSTSTIPTPADPLLCSSLMRAVRMMKQDAEFASHATNEFEAIIRDDPMALTISPILGKMWRELCKKRSDPRRDELIVLLSQRKHSLSSADREVCYPRHFHILASAGLRGVA